MKYLPGFTFSFPICFSFCLPPVFPHLPLPPSALLLPPSVLPSPPSALPSPSSAPPLPPSSPSSPFSSRSSFPSLLGSILPYPRLFRPSVFLRGWGTRLRSALSAFALRGPYPGKCSRIPPPRMPCSYFIATVALSVPSPALRSSAW